MTRLSEMILNIDLNLNFEEDDDEDNTEKNDDNGKINENNKDINSKELNIDSKDKETENFSISSPKRRSLKRKTTKSIVLLQSIKKRNMIMTEKTPINALQRLLSEKNISKNLKFLDFNIHDDNNSIAESDKSSSQFKETFKTGLHDTKSSLRKTKNSKLNRKHKNNKIIKNLEIMLNNPDKLDELTSHISPNKRIKFSDYENIKNFGIENLYDSELVKTFNEHKKLLLEIKKKKKEADKFVRSELDRIGKCFYIEDYSGKFNTNIQTVISALIGEDNSRLEVFKQEREQKEYFKTIKNLRTFSLLNKKKI